MKKIIFMLISALLASSCNTRLVCKKRSPVDQYDSISNSIKTVTVIRDTSIYVNLPGDSVFVTTPIDEVSRLNTSLASSTAWIKNGKISHRLEQKDTTIPATIKGALKTTTTKSDSTHTIHQTRYINRLSGWQWTQVYLGRLFMGLLAVIFLSKIVNAVH